VGSGQDEEFDGVSGKEWEMKNGRFDSGNVKSAKLTWAQVRRMRELYAVGWTQGKLTREFDVGIAQVGRIVRNESWRETRAGYAGGETVGAGVPTPTAFLEDLMREQEMRKELEGETPKPEDGVKLAMKAVRERAGGFGQVVDIPEPGRDMAPGDYSDPTGRRGEGK